MHYVYIIYSTKLGKYYVGETALSPDARLDQHNTGMFHKFTKPGIPWALYHTIECVDRSQALRIERHIKEMKSTKYIVNLKHFPEIAEKLKTKYS